MSITAFLRMLRSHGLSLGTAQILFDLAKHPGANPLSEVAARIGISRAAMTDFRDQLAAKGMIYTPTNGYDRRKKGIELTNKGHRKVFAILQKQPMKTQ